MKRPAAIPFVDLKAQYRTLAPELRAAIGGVLGSGNFVLGPWVERFEREFARFVGTPHAVGVSSGLDALHLALMALDIGPGDEVVVPASTFIATALAVSASGAKPVLVDCDAGTFNLDPAGLKAAFSRRTKAVIAVHLAGQPADMRAIMKFARSRKVPVIEDAAQAHGALYHGKQCGSLGLIGAFSFYPGKNLGAYGDGGMVTTRDSRLAERIRRLRHYGQRAKYEHVEKGLNARLDAVQAAILSVKLKHLDRWNALRNAHARRYLRLLSGTPGLSFQEALPGATHVYHLFLVETSARDGLREHLRRAGIEAGIHYPQPIHLLEAYRDLGHRKGDFPNAERHARRTLSLPMYAELQPSQIQRVAAEVSAFLRS